MLILRIFFVYFDEYTIAPNLSICFTYNIIILILIFLFFCLHFTIIIYDVDIITPFLSNLIIFCIKIKQFKKKSSHFLFIFEFVKNFLDHNCRLNCFIRIFTVSIRHLNDSCLLEAILNKGHEK